MSTAIPYTCASCGCPIDSGVVWVGEGPMHTLCAFKHTSPPTLIPARDRYVPPSITEDRVREIVREEIIKAFTK